MKKTTASVFVKGLSMLSEKSPGGLDELRTSIAELNAVLSTDDSAVALEHMAAIDHDGVVVLLQSMFLMYGVDMHKIGGTHMQTGGRVILKR